MSLNFNALKSYDGKVTDQDLNRVVDALQSIMLNPGVNYRILRTPAGTTIQPGGTNAAPATICPFTVSLAKIPDDDTNLSAKVSPGTVNQLIAGNAFDSFTVAKTGLYYVKAGIETDGQSVSTVSLYIDTDEPDTQTPTPFALPASFDIVLAVINDGKVFRIIGCGSISLTGHEEFRTDKDSPAEPGELNYIPYYTWQQTLI